MLKCLIISIHLKSCFSLSLRGRNRVYVSSWINHIINTDTLRDFFLKHSLGLGGFSGPSQLSEKYYTGTSPQTGWFSGTSPLAGVFYGTSLQAGWFSGTSHQTGGILVTSPQAGGSRDHSLDWGDCRDLNRLGGFWGPLPRLGGSLGLSLIHI